MNKFILFLACIALTACASPIGYVKKKGGDPQFDTGYSETMIKSDLYNVNYLGNGKNSNDEARKFFLKRSAEISKDKGFKGFCILKEGPDNKGWGGAAAWIGHSGDIKLTNDIKGDYCFASNDQTKL